MAITATIVLDSATVKEGGFVSGKLVLSEPSSLATTLTLTIKSTGPAAVWHKGVFGTMPAGQTVFTFKAPVYDDANLGNGVFEVSGVLSGADFNAFPSPKTGTVLDNDTAAFVVSTADPLVAYKAVTRLTTTDIWDEMKLTDFTLRDYSTREFIEKMSVFGRDTTSVALTTYQFFTGKIPGEAGVNYLVNSPDNPHDLRDADGMYASFNLENRYINFAANLGLQGEGKDAFAAGYKSLTWGQAVEKAYDAIIGKAYATLAGINVDAALASITASKPYFEAVARERMGGFDQDLAMKAGLVGYILAEAIKADVGIYARGVENFYLDATDGVAKYGVDLVGTYGPGTPVDLI